MILHRKRQPTNRCLHQRLQFCALLLNVLALPNHRLAPRRAKQCCERRHKLDLRHFHAWTDARTGGPWQKGPGDRRDDAAVAVDPPRRLELRNVTAPDLGVVVDRVR